MIIAVMYYRIKYMFKESFNFVSLYPRPGKTDTFHYLKNSVLRQILQEDNANGEVSVRFLWWSLVVIMPFSQDLRLQIKCFTFSRAINLRAFSLITTKTDIPFHFLTDNCCLNLKNIRYKLTDLTVLLTKALCCLPKAKSQT